MSWLSALQWRYEWAGLLVLLPVASLLLALWRQQRLGAYADAALRPWAMRTAGSTRGILRWMSQLVFWVLLATAAAGPYIIETTATKAGVGTARTDVEVLVLVDASGSPLEVSTTESSREQQLARVRRALHDLGSVMQGERLGLVSYSTRADLIYRPSHNYSLLSFYFPLLKDVTPAGAAHALPDALVLARQVLLERGKGSRLVLLLTRSAPALSRGGALHEAVRALAQDGIGLAVIPLQAGGDTAHAHLADAGAGSIVRLPAGRAGWVEFYEDLIVSLPSHAAPEGARRVRQEMFMRFLVPALLLWFAGMLWRSVPSRWLSMWPLAMSLLIAGTAMTPQQVLAQQSATSSELRRAYAFYTQGDYDQAQLVFATLAGAQARLGEGAAAYRRGDYDRAGQLFQRAVLLATDDETRADALFNLGNTRFRQERYALAMQSYYGVLEYRKEDAAARHNLWQASRYVPTLRDESQRAGNRPGLRSGDGPARQEPPPDTPEFVFSDLQEGSGGQQADSEAGRRVASGEASATVESGADALADMGASLYRTQADTRAALKKLELIDDDPAQGLRALLEREAVTRRRPAAGDAKAAGGKASP